MKLFCLFYLCLSIAFAQTRPTGGTGPDPELEISRKQELDALDLLISEKVSQNYDQCGMVFTKPDSFNIYQVYTTLNTLNVLKLLKDIHLDHKHFPLGCDQGVVHLTPQMQCLLEETYNRLNLFVKNPHVLQYLKMEYHLAPKDAQNMLNFLYMINYSLEAIPFKK